MKKTIQNRTVTIKKSNLPQKDCIICGRPFSWRKKWEKDWENVKYCSDKCRTDHKTREYESH
jgi:hypothetical protein